MYFHCVVSNLYRRIEIRVQPLDDHCAQTAAPNNTFSTILHQCTTNATRVKKTQTRTDVHRWRHTRSIDGATQRGEKQRLAKQKSAAATEAPPNGHHPKLPKGCIAGSAATLNITPKSTTARWRMSESTEAFQILSKSLDLFFLKTKQNITNM